MSQTQDLRSRAVDALLSLAALETDGGGAGYCEGVASNYRAGRYSGKDEAAEQRYVERVEAAAAKLAAEHGVASVEVSGANICVVRSNGRRGYSIGCGKVAEAKRLAERLLALGASA